MCIRDSTYSKTKDNGEGAFDSVADLNLNFVEPFATSRLDFPHVFSFETVYDLPWGTGRRWGTNWNRGLNAVLGGWQINGIFRAQSGQTFDVRRDGVRAVSYTHLDVYKRQGSGQTR